ncbi:hypothetical protein D3C86_1192320 [compost metagenome]
MNAERIDVVGAQLRLAEQLMQMCRHLEQCEVEHLATVHEEHTVGDFQMWSAGTIGAELGLAQCPGRVITHPGSRGRIAEQHGGVAVFRVDDLRIRVGRDQQAVLQASGFHEALDRIDAVDVTGTAQGNIERGDAGRQAEFVLHDGRGMRQAFFVTVLGDDDQRIDGLAFQIGVAGKQRIGRFNAQIGSFLINALARQESRTDLAQDEFFILLEFCTLCVIVHAGYRNVARNALYANHYGFPIINSPIPPLAAIEGRRQTWISVAPRRRPGSIKGHH